MSNFFPSHPEALAKQEEGLRLASVGNCHDAHAAFTVALVMMDDARLPYAAERLQRATILRDDGFTYVREGFAFGRGELIDRGAATLDSSLELTGKLLTGGFAPSVRARKRLYSEHGQTAALRNHTDVLEALFGGEHPDAEVVGHFSIIYQDHLRQGSNQYFIANTALRAAACEVMTGEDRIHAMRWVGVAAVAFGRSLVSDRQNTIPVARTIIARTPGLRAAETAHWSLFDRRIRQ